MKKTAKAHPIQGLIKYHGLRDPLLKIPYHDSISVCTEPTMTRTTVEFGSDHKEDVVQVDGKILTGTPLERALLVIGKARELANSDERCKVVSENIFPSNVGLGASASGFAALALASSAALGLKPSMRELSSMARLGAGSASRSMVGGFSRWYGGTGHDDSYAAPLASGSDLQLGIVVAVVRAHKDTIEIHKEVEASPYLMARLAYIHEALAEMEAAIRNRKIENIGDLAERDTLNLYGMTMTGKKSKILWKPRTLMVMAEVRRMREDHGIPAYFSVDTGATVYINTYPDRVSEVEGYIKDIKVLKDPKDTKEGKIETMRCGVGGKAELLSEHLF